MSPARLGAAAATALALLAACSGEGGGTAQKEERVAAIDTSVPTPELMSAPAEIAAPAPAGEARPQSGPAGPNLPASAAGTDTSVAPTMLIRNGEATVQVDSLEPAIAQVRRIAQASGGFIANTSMSTGAREARRASLQVKVPAARFDQVVSGLRPLGKLESVNVTTEDVGEEFVDVSARVANARRLEERLTNLLATRTGKLEDVLAVERELARVREEIERYEGRIRYLRTRAAVSTLTVNLHEPIPVVGADQPGTSPIAEAVRQAWRNFVGFFAGLIAALGFLVPLGVLAWIAWKLFRRVRGAPGDRGPTKLGIHRPAREPLRDGTTDAAE